MKQTGNRFDIRHKETLTLFLAEEQILIYWEHHGDKPPEIQRRVFHCFCGVYFKFKKPVFPVVMFTDPAAYLPLTDYPKKDRPLIKAKAFKGIAAVEEGPKRSVLYSLIDHSLPLEPDEEKAGKKA